MAALFEILISLLLLLVYCLFFLCLYFYFVQGMHSGDLVVVLLVESNKRCATALIPTTSPTFGTLTVTTPSQVNDSTIPQACSKLAAILKKCSEKNETSPPGLQRKQNLHLMENSIHFSLCANLALQLLFSHVWKTKKIKK